MNGYKPASPLDEADQCQKRLITPIAIPIRPDIPVIYQYIEPGKHAGIYAVGIK
jgi:hypothetical protein